MPSLFFKRSMLKKPWFKRTARKTTESESTEDSENEHQEEKRLNGSDLKLSDHTNIEKKGSTGSDLSLSDSTKQNDCLKQKESVKQNGKRKWKKKDSTSSECSSLNDSTKQNDCMMQNDCLKQRGCLMQNGNGGEKSCQQQNGGSPKIKSKFSKLLQNSIGYTKKRNSSKRFLTRQNSIDGSRSNFMNQKDVSQNACGCSSDFRPTLDDDLISYKSYVGDNKDNWREASQEDSEVYRGVLQTGKRTKSLDSNLPAKTYDVTAENSDVDSPEPISDTKRRRHLFRRSISLRRSLLRRSQKRKHRSLETPSGGHVVAPPTPEVSPWTFPVDSGIEDSDNDAEMSSNDGRHGGEDEFREMLDPLPPATERKLSRSQSFKRGRKKIENFFTRRKSDTPVSSPDSNNSQGLPPEGAALGGGASGGGGWRWPSWSSGESLDRRMSQSSISSVGSDQGEFYPGRLAHPSAARCAVNHRRASGPAQVFRGSDQGDGDPRLLAHPSAGRNSLSYCRASGPSPIIRDLAHSARSWTKEEYVYRLLIQSVVNPLGAPDLRPGFRPKELAQHLRQVFGVDPLQHEAILRDTQLNTSAPVVLTVNVVEGRNLRPMDANGLSDPYCILCLAKPNGRPSVDLRNSPTSSPTRRRKSSVEPTDLRRTHTVKATLHPKWNQAFEIEVRDISGEELLVYLWDNDEGAPITDSMKYIESQKTHGIKSWLKQIKTSVEYGKAGDDFLGTFRVPLKDIPATGLDAWFDLYEDKKGKIKVQGQCRLRLELAWKPHYSIDQLDCAESDQCSLDDFHSIVTQIYKHAITQANTSIDSDVLPELSKIPSPSRSILNQFAVQHHISRLSQQATELTVLLELSTSRVKTCIVTERLIKDVISAVDTEWMTSQMGYLSNGDNNNINLSFSEKTFLSDSEAHVFERAASAFIEQSIKNLTEIPVLFPPFLLQLEALNNQISLLVDLLSLNIWPNSVVSRKELSNLIVQSLQKDVRMWAQNKLDSVQPDLRVGTGVGGVGVGAAGGGDSVLPEVKLQVHLLQDCATILTPTYSIAQYFNKIGVDYFRVASLTMESRLAQKAQELMQRMDKYQVRYQKYQVNIRDSSQVSLQLYLTLRNFYNMVKSNICERELFRLTVSNYQSWFETAVIFWLHTFREECIRRTDKALEIDRDVVQVTAMVKYSNSSVDVLSCFTKMTMEWRHIDFGSADICLLGVTKITDTICDCARQYAERIMTILEKNGYYDAEQENQFDVKDQVCITINNMEHVREYLMELPQRLNFETVTQCMSIKHEDESVGKQALATLNRLVKSADSDIKTRCCLLLTRITSKMAVDLNKYTQNFTKRQPDKTSSVDPLLAYLESNLQVLYERLETSTFPHMLAHLWQATLECFYDTLMTGRPPTYYEEMYSHLRSLRAYFLRGGIKETSLDTDLFNEVHSMLQLNCMTTPELMLQYYHNLAESLGTQLEYYGHLALRIGFMKETGNTATIYVTVCGGQHLPAIRSTGTSDPLISVSLVPCSLFPSRVVKTTVAKATINPTFRQTFQFPGIPIEFLSTPGAAAVFTAWHQEMLLPNEYLGEVLVSLSDVPEISPNQTIEDLSVALLPLKRPKEPNSGPYKVICERSDWEPLARTFLKRRRVMAGYTTSVPMCAPVKKMLSKMLGRQGAEDITRNSLFGSSPVM